MKRKGKTHSNVAPWGGGKRPGSTYRGKRLNAMRGERASLRLKAIRKQMGLSRSEFDKALWKTRLLQAKSITGKAA